MCCPLCKARCAYTEDPSQKPVGGMIPIAQRWRYMDGQQVQPGALFYCTECNSYFGQPMIQDVIEEDYNANE